MLTLPDFKEKKIVFIQANKELDSKIRFQNDNLCVFNKEELINQISCHRIFSVFIIGSTSITSVLLNKLRKYGISLFILADNFSLVAEIMSQAEGNYILRSKQYFTTDSLAIAKNIVINKASNQFDTLMASKCQIDPYFFIESTTGKIVKASNLQQLLGIEGNLSKKYFNLLFKEIGWLKRSPQTKIDITNLLLDIGYAFLFNYTDSLLKLFGFDTYKGYYHQLFFQRKSLSCDLMEPGRCLIERALLKAYRLKRIRDEDFTFRNGGFIMKSDPQIRKKYTSIFFEAIANHKENLYIFIRNFYRLIMGMEQFYIPFKVLG